MGTVLAVVSSKQGGGMDGALVVAIVAAVFAGLAAVFAGWSGWNSHRSAKFASEAVALERDRHHRELIPRIELEQGHLPDGEDEGVWFLNAGPFDYPEFAFALAPPLVDQPIVGFLFGDDVVTAGVLGRLPLGSRRFLRYKRHAPDEGQGTLRLLLTCSNDQGTWTIPAEVEIPGVPFIGVAWR